MTWALRFFLPALFLSLAGTASHASNGVEGVFQRIKGEALKKSYELRIAEENEAQASSGHYTAITRWLPHVDLQLSQTHSIDYSILTSGALGTLPANFTITPQALSLSRWDLNLTLPIFKRSIQLGLAQSSADQQRASDLFRLRQTELDWRLRSLIGNYLTQRYKEAALQTSIEIAERNLREATLRFELGQRTKVDVLRSKANLLSLQSKKLLYQQQRSTALSDLLEYSGLTEEELNQLGLETRPSDSKFVSSEETLLRAIDDFTRLDDVMPRIRPFLESSAPSKELESQITRSSAPYASFLSEEQSSIKKARSLTSQEWPDLAFRGNLNKQGPGWDVALSAGNFSYSLGLVLSVPLFSGGSLFSSSSEQSHALAASVLKTEKDILHFKNEIETDRIQIRTLLTTLESQNLNLEQNEELVKLSFKSYQLGKSTLVELLTAQNDLIDSKINLAQTKQDLATSARKFAWNIGVPLP